MSAEDGKILQTIPMGEGAQTDAGLSHSTIAARKALVRARAGTPLLRGQKVVRSFGNGPALQNRHAALLFQSPGPGIAHPPGQGAQPGPVEPVWWQTADGERRIALRLRLPRGRGGNRLALTPADLHLTGLVSEHGYEGREHWLMFLFEVKPRWSTCRRRMGRGIRFF